MNCKNTVITACVLCLASGCIETNELVPFSDNDYAEACTDLAWCIISCVKPEECVACVRDHEAEGFVPVAAFDAIECRAHNCDFECNEADVDTCERCLESRCADTWDACNGRGWQDYETEDQRHLVECRDALLCIEACSDDNYDCNYSCYNHSNPDVRRDVYLFLTYFWGDCLWACQGSGAAGCVQCLEVRLGQEMPQCLSTDGALGLDPSRVSRLH